MEKTGTRNTAVWVIRAAVTTALGDTLETSWVRLLEGRTAIRPVTRFSTAPYPIELAACIESLNPGKTGSMLHPLIDRVLEEIIPIPEDTLLITATTKGPIDILERACRGPAVPVEDFLIPNFVEGLSRRLGLAAPGFNVSAACASSAIAVAHAATRIASGKSGSVLVLGADLVTEFVFSGFSSLQILSDQPCMPFDRNRRGLSLGEGASAILMMGADRARAVGFLPLAEICGWGSAGDADHITAPARDGSGLVRAVRHALGVAGLGPEAIAAVHAHGTGTLHNDRMELAAFHTLFGNREIPIHSVKGAIGHTLGAAGGIELALSIKSLHEGVIPPTVGVAVPELSAGARILPKPLPMSPGFILSSNSGFGGINAALVVGKGPTS